ncbi:hypothetical protein CRE_25178 [Caenorhabditis remanei]|uniref:Sdz-33 F-box domain-containing protein n=1 Tax=Caenorhabditis remanei TaxID=31234 RepID=E3LTC9_CAERE|nr:hypothetical protein CRE_25178 [Caenorhabditis remanei]
MEKPVDLTEFPIYNLDYVSLNEIYRNLTLIDIFELSFTTTDIKNTLKDASVPVQSIRISFASRHPSIHLKALGSEFLWTFGRPENIVITGQGEYKIQQFKFNCQRSRHGYHTEHFDAEHGMLAVIRYLVAIFNCADSVISELSIDLGVIEDCRSVCEQFTKFKSVERLAIHQSVDIERNKLNFAQNFEWIMENLEIKEVYIGVDLMDHKMIQNEKGDFEIRSFPLRLDRILKMNHICLAHAAWVTPQDLLNLDVETAIIINHQFTNDDLNAFMKQWLESTSNKLCWLEVKLDEERHQKPEICKDLDMRESTYRQTSTRISCPYRRTDSVKPIHFDLPADTEQITRLDGLIATVAITNDTFFFHVSNTGPIFAPVAQPAEPTENERAIEERIRLLDLERMEIEFDRRNHEMERILWRFPGHNHLNNALDELRGDREADIFEQEIRREAIEAQLDDLRAQLNRLRRARRAALLNPIVDIQLDQAAIIELARQHIEQQMRQ